jgi:hypothetical protein
MFEAYLDSLTSDTPGELPITILDDETTSEPTEHDVDVEQRQFPNRLAAGKYLVETLSSSRISDIGNVKGLWAWLSLFYFEQLCPVDKSGRRKPGQRARWIPAVGDFRKYYRHLLAGPYRIYRAHRDDPSRALSLLCGDLNTPGEIVEQLTSRQELVTNNAIVETATTLYVDPDTSQPKRGAAGKGPGSARRLADIMNQFDVTYDLYSMGAGDIIAMLPPEFKRFKPNTT